MHTQIHILFTYLLLDLLHLAEENLSGKWQNLGIGVGELPVIKAGTAQ